MKKIIIVISFLFLMIYAIELVDSRRMSGRKKNRKEKNEEKSKSDDSEEDITDDLKNLEPNTTISCYVCSSSSCSETRVDCDPGQVCWKGKTIQGEFKGCASRQCIPINDYSTETIFTSNICCISDFCNSAMTKHLLLSLISFLCFKCLFIYCFLK